MTLLKACFIRRRQLPSRWFLSFCNSCLVSISPFPCTPLSLSDPPIQKEVVKSYIFTFLIRELWISKLVKPLQDVPSNFYIKSYHHCCRLYQMKYFKKITLLAFLFSSNVCAQIIWEMPGKLMSDLN